MNRKRNATVLMNNRGSALLTTFLVLIVLVALGLAMTTLAVANYQQSTTIDNYERNYYSAEGAAQLALDNLKREVRDYYNDMAIARANTANLTEYNVLYDNFFANIRSNAAASFADPEVAVYAGVGPDTVSTTYLTPAKIDSDTYRFTIESTATGARAARTVTASIVIKRNGITYIPGSLPPPYGEQSLIAGGTLDLTSASAVHINNSLGTGNGSILVGDYKSRNSAITTPEQAYAAETWRDGLYMNNRSAGGWIDPMTIMGIAWNESYPGFTKPAPAVVTPSIAVITNGQTVTDSNFPKDKKNKPIIPSPLYLEGAAGAFYTVSGMDVTGGGQFVSDKALTLTGGSGYKGTSGNWLTLYGGGNVNIGSTTIGYVRLYCDGDFTWGGSASGPVEVYCKGNVTINGIVMKNCKIVCGGNVSISGGNSTDVTLYCKGDLNDSSTNRTNAQYYVGGEYKMTGGNFIGESLVYAEKKLSLESTCSGFFYTNGDAVIYSGAGITGQLVAKGNVKVNGSFDFKYDGSIVNAALDKLDGTPLDTSGTTREPQLIQPVNGAIFMSETDPKDKD